MTAIELRDVSRVYGDVVAVDGVSLSIDGQGLHCLLGPNGSGKTTLFRMLVGLERPSAGSIARDGDAVGCGFQHPTFYPSLSVRENLAVFAELEGDVDPDWRERLVAELRLPPVLDRAAGDLSGGYARRLDLALAFLDEPDVVVLDEPLGALDDVSSRRLLEFLAAYRDAGRCVVVSTPRASAFEPYLDRLTVLAEGEVLLDADFEAVDLGNADSLEEFYVGLVRGRLEGGSSSVGGD